MKRVISYRVPDVSKRETFCSIRVYNPFRSGCTDRLHPGLKGLYTRMEQRLSKFETKRRYCQNE